MPFEAIAEKFVKFQYPEMFNSFKDYKSNFQFIIPKNKSVTTMNRKHY